MDQAARFRINLSSQEIEIEGNEAFVREQIEKYQDFIEGYKGQPLASQGSVATHKHLPDVLSTSQSSSGLPASFGEYLHAFPKTITQNDEILIAGFYVQKNSSENSFTTEAANSHLLEVGVRLANPSTSVSRNKTSKTIFAVSRGVFRVSSSGEEYIKSLLEKTK